MPGAPRGHGRQHLRVDLALDEIVAGRRLPRRDSPPAAPTPAASDRAVGGAVNRSWPSAPLRGELRGRAGGDRAAVVDDHQSGRRAARPRPSWCVVSRTATPSRRSASISSHTRAGPARPDPRSVRRGTPVPAGRRARTPAPAAAAARRTAAGRGCGGLGEAERAQQPVGIQRIGGVRRDQVEHLAGARTRVARRRPAASRRCGRAAPRRRRSGRARGHGRCRHRGGRSPRTSRRWWSCPRRWVRAGRAPGACATRGRDGRRL